VSKGTSEDGKGPVPDWPILSELGHLGIEVRTG
jgi:hypothetical protein